MQHMRRVAMEIPMAMTPEDTEIQEVPEILLRKEYHQLHSRNLRKLHR